MQNKLSGSTVKGPLTEFRLVELGQLIAGTFRGQLMVDMGVGIIKAEPPVLEHIRHVA